MEIDRLCNKILGSALLVDAEQGDTVVIVITCHVATTGTIHRELTMAPGHRSGTTYVSQIDTGHCVTGCRGGARLCIGLVISGLHRSRRRRWIGGW